MGILYRVDKTTILNYAKKIRYTNTPKYKLTDEDKKFIISMYNSMTSTDLAKKFNVSRGMITKVWYDNHLNGKDTHQYPFNYDYFSSIDSKDKAYFLGLLASDGADCFINAMQMNYSNKQHMYEKILNNAVLDETSK